MTVIALPERVYYSAYDVPNGAFIANDEANHTLTFRRDGVNFTPTNSPTNVANGTYEVVLTDAERVGETLLITGASSTTGVIIQPIAQSSETRLLGMTYPDPTTPTVAAYAADAHAILSQHVTDVGQAIIVHGDGAGGWGEVADTSGLATSTELAALQTHGDTEWSTADVSALALEASVQLVITTGGVGPWTTGSGGEQDWTTTERSQIRNRLGIDGEDAVPSAVPTLALEASVQSIIATGNANWITYDPTGDILDTNVVSWDGAVEPVNEWTLQTTSIKSNIAVDGTTSPTATDFSTNLTEQTPDHWKNRSVIMLTGGLALQASLITGYAFTSGKGVLTVEGFTGPPQVGDTLLIV